MPWLTPRIDALRHRMFGLAEVHQIALWKLNRYVDPPSCALGGINMTRRLKPGEHQRARSIIELLLNARGIGLPMASTILRFRNPDVFQIIDRHAYYALYGQQLELPARVDQMISMYFTYLGDLHRLAKTKNIDFASMDRTLYVLRKRTKRPSAVADAPPRKLGRRRGTRRSLSGT